MLLDSWSPCQKEDLPPCFLALGNPSGDVHCARSIHYSELWCTGVDTLRGSNTMPTSRGSGLGRVLLPRALGDRLQTKIHHVGVSGIRNLSWGVCRGYQWDQLRCHARQWGCGGVQRSNRLVGLICHDELHLCVVGTHLDVPTMS